MHDPWATNFRVGQLASQHPVHKGSAVKSQIQTVVFIDYFEMLLFKGGHYSNFLKLGEKCHFLLVK